MRKWRKMIPESPLFTIEVDDESVGLEGYVCIHSIGPNGSSGGMRCVEDITKKEIQMLAKAMTFKYSFFGIPQGGAKAGLRLPYGASQSERKRLIKLMAQHLEPVIKRSSIWSVWTDMNFYKDDHQFFHNSIGLMTNYGGTGGSTVRTGISGAWSIEAMSNHIGLEQNKAKVSFEGYGGVAQVAAKLLVEKGFRIVALSNHIGAVYNENGLDLVEVNGAKERVGHEWVNSAGSWSTLERSDIFGVPSDIFVPGARVHSIKSDVAKVLDSQAIVPVANVPCTYNALNVIDSRGIAYLPDYVVNGGGVCGWIKSDKDLFGEHFKRMIGRGLRLSEDCGESVRILCDNIANASFNNSTANAYEKYSIMDKLVRRSLQNPIVSNLHRKYGLRKRIKTMCDRLDMFFS